MSIVLRYQTKEGPRWGLLIDGAIHAWEGDPFTDPDREPGEALPQQGEITILPPVRPSKIVCVGRNYAEHAAEHQAEVPDEPMLFLKPPSALIGQHDAIVLPPDVGRIDHEAEIAVIIGQMARSVSEADAAGVVLGYTCANDVSARVLQKKDKQWGRAKGFDTFCPLGPWINTALDPSDLRVRAFVNGEVRQDARTSSMVFNIPHLIAFISGIMTLEPGDVILTGTPAGVSEIHAGDTVRIEIEGIGSLINTVTGA